MNHQGLPECQLKRPLLAFLWQISDRLAAMKEFLRNNEDLRNGLLEDMQKLDSLHLQHQKPEAEEPGEEPPASATEGAWPEDAVPSPCPLTAFFPVRPE